MAFKIALILHIAGGIIGLLTGLINVIRKKGDKNHKILGKLFYYSMLTAGFSSLALSSLRPNYFLFMVGVFTLYMVSVGQRYLKHKQDDKKIIRYLDWIISTVMLISGLLFFVLGLLSLLKSNAFGLVFITFGCLGLVFVRQDFKNFTNKSRIKNYWLIGHLQRMTGGFISSLTAFLVVNIKYFPNIIPGIIYWLLPTVVFTPLIIKWVKQYKIKI